MYFSSWGIVSKWQFYNLYNTLKVFISKHFYRICYFSSFSEFSVNFHSYDNNLIPFQKALEI